MPGRPDPERVVVVGAGVSGLACASALRRERPAVEVSVLEGDARIGGLVRTDQPMPGVRVELGPDSFSKLAGVTPPLLASLALADAVVDGGLAARRAFLGKKGGRLQAIPPSLMGGKWAAHELFTTRVLGSTTKLRLALEPFVRARASTSEESAAEFVERRFGRGFLDDALGPLLQAIYGAPASELGAAEVLARFTALERAHGSVARGMRAPTPPTEAAPIGVVTLREGMEQLPRALAAALGTRVHTNARVARVERLLGRFRVRLRDGSMLEADRVVLATPPHVAAKLLAHDCPRAAEELARVRSQPVETVSLLFRASDAPPVLDGTGFVLAEGAARVLSAMSWCNRKWRERTPEGFELIRCTVRGRGRSDAELREALMRDLGDWLGPAGEPCATFVDRGRVSLPVLGVGHRAAMARAREALAERGGIHVVGNGIDGLGVSDCMRAGEALARRVVAGASAHEAA